MNCEAKSPVTTRRTTTNDDSERLNSTSKVLSMWLSFKKDTEAYRARKARIEADVQALAKGEILPRAKHRIDHHMTSGARLYSTDMTVNEYMLIEECGVQPLGQVMGTCF